MEWYIYFASISFLISGFVLLLTFFKRVQSKSLDFSKGVEDTNGAVFYSFTKAMSPFAKESAYLHLPTYVSGIIYHIGSFVAIAFFLFALIFPNWNEILSNFAILIEIVLLLSVLFGLFILFKRFIKSDLRSLSIPDDYFSNLFTSCFQLCTFLYMIDSVSAGLYFTLSALFFLWLPVGKTRHLVYFFVARIYLGRFYGKRGTWPEKH